MRKQALEHRKNMDPYSEDPDEACHLFFDALKPQPGQVVSAYWPMGKEFDTTLLLERLLKEDCICALPVIDNGNKVLKFARWHEGEQLEKSAFGVMQPAVNENTEWVTPDIVIVPMLAFDRHGHRLGYGGGHYDATLQHLRQNGTVTAVGLAYAQQAVLFNLPVEDHDEQLDWIITPLMAQRYS